MAFSTEKLKAKLAQAADAQVMQLVQALMQQAMAALGSGDATQLGQLMSQLTTSAEGKKAIGAFEEQVAQSENDVLKGLTASARQVASSPAGSNMRFLPDAVNMRNESGTGFYHRDEQGRAYLYTPGHVDPETNSPWMRVEDRDTQPEDQYVSEAVEDRLNRWSSSVRAQRMAEEDPARYESEIERLRGLYSEDAAREWHRQNARTSWSWTNPYQGSNQLARQADDLNEQAHLATTPEEQQRLLQQSQELRQRAEQSSADTAEMVSAIPRSGGAGYLSGQVVAGPDGKPRVYDKGTNSLREMDSREQWYRGNWNVNQRDPSSAVTGQNMARNWQRRQQRANDPNRVGQLIRMEIANGKTLDQAVASVSANYGGHVAAAVKDPSFRSKAIDVANQLTRQQQPAPRPSTSPIKTPQPTSKLPYPGTAPTTTSPVQSPYPTSPAPDTNKKPLGKQARYEEVLDTDFGAGLYDSGATAAEMLSQLSKKEASALFDAVMATPGVKLADHIDPATLPIWDFMCMAARRHEKIGSYNWTRQILTPMLKTAYGKALYRAVIEPKKATYQDGFSTRKEAALVRGVRVDHRSPYQFRDQRHTPTMRNGGMARQGGGSFLTGGKYQPHINTGRFATGGSYTPFPGRLSSGKAAVDPATPYKAYDPIRWFQPGGNK